MTETGKKTDDIEIERGENRQRKRKKESQWFRDTGRRDRGKREKRQRKIPRIRQRKRQCMKKIDRNFETEKERKRDSVNDRKK